VYELDRRLVTLLVFRRDSLSRNRHFHAFDEPSMRRARRIATHLRAILRRVQLDPHLSVHVFEEGPGQVRLELRAPQADLIHNAWLSTDEWNILLMAPVVAARAGLPVVPFPDDESD
jgi:hypothetical protein